MGPWDLCFWGGSAVQGKDYTRATYWTLGLVLLGWLWCAAVQGNQLMRALHVAAFAVSGYACTAGRVQKPFNPLIRETFEADIPRIKAGASLRKRWG